MIDSSIGGKTGLDLKEGKNLIGTFYHPKAVLIDTRFLDSLSDNEVNSGLFEAIKYGVLYSEDFLDYISDNLTDIRDSQILANIITECCSIKSSIVFIFNLLAKNI